MDKDIKLQDLRLYCRACLGIFDGQMHDLQEIDSPLRRLLSYAGLKMPQIDLFSKSICSQCYNIIKQFEEFQIKLKQSTQYMEGLLSQTETNEALVTDEYIEEPNSIEHVEKDIKKLQSYPLRENEDFETVSVKLEIEVNQTSSGEEETNDEKDSNSVDPILEQEKETDSQSAHLLAQYSLIPFDDKRSGTAKIICKYGCGKEFRRAPNADAHYRVKHKSMETKLIKAENSGPKETKTPKRTEIVTIKNISSTNKTTCTICFKNLATLAGLRSHKATHDEVRPFQCDQCNRGFNMKARLNRHIREIHEENPPEIPCKFGCGKLFTRHESAMNHYRVKHILPEKGVLPKTNTYVCEDCGKIFKTMYNLKEHSYTHRPHAERPFQCEQCKKRFISKRSHEIHLLRHAGIKNFECKICGLKTTTQNELRNHMNHHTKAKQVNCPICSKTYTNPDNLRRHTLIVHQGVKNYKCRFCEEKFGKPDHLKHHEMRHTGERPHKCEICDRGFIQLVALKAHMKTHNKTTKIRVKEII